MADAAFPSDTADKFVVRLPAGMRERIAEEAKAAGRSMNAEIVARLQRSLGEGPAINGISMNELFKKLEHLEAIVAERIGPSPAPKKRAK